MRFQWRLGSVNIVEGGLEGACADLCANTGLALVEVLVGTMLWLGTMAVRLRLRRCGLKRGFYGHVCTQGFVG